MEIISRTGWVDSLPDVIWLLPMDDTGHYTIAPESVEAWERAGYYQRRLWFGEGGYHWFDEGVRWATSFAVKHGTHTEFISVRKS